ncbi:hypothetical protein ACT4UL_13740, partial [Bacillus sp. HC-TM]
KHICITCDMFLDGWNESVYSIAKVNQPSIVLPIRKLISNDKKELLFDQVHPNDKWLIHFCNGINGFIPAV